MKFDNSLMTGLFLGITVGLYYAGDLMTFMPFFVLLTLVYVLRYVHSH